MLFNAIYRLPIWKNIDKSTRAIRLFVIGLIIYIILYIYLNSSFSDNLQLIKAYKDYIYYLFAVDTIMFTYVFYTDYPLKKKKSKQLKKCGNKQRMPMNRMLPIQQMYQLQQNQPQSPPQNQLQNKHETKPNDIESVNIPLYEPINNTTQDESLDIPIYNN